MTEVQENCPICGIKAKQFCSACKTVKYCGVEHQKKHWKIHKNVCLPFFISEASDVGRFLQATRDINVNTVIFTESPLIIGPKWYLTEKETAVPVTTCVGCFNYTKIGECSCPRCTWPVCSLNCPGLDSLKGHALECPILSLREPLKCPYDIKSAMDYYRTDALIVLKCLMLQKVCPKKWHQLMNMQSHEEDRIDSELYLDAENRIVSYLMTNYIDRLKSYEAHHKTKILEECDAKLLHKICGIIETNYMVINLPNGSDLAGIFYKACMMEHSCLPNCFFTFDFNNNFKISVIAGRNLKKDEHLKITYSNMLWGTLLRQEHLQLTKHFTCTCERCKDPTELGTYFSGLKCMGIDLNSCDGIQLPEDPLNQSSDWKCDKCSVKISGEEVRYLLTQMGNEVDALLYDKKPTIIELEDLINKLLKFLHKNHYLLFNLKHTLIQLYGNQENDSKNEEILLRKVEMCDQLEEICNVLDPNTLRLSFYVGIILYEKHKALITLNKLKLENLQKDSSADKSEVLENFKQIRQHLLRANEVLKKVTDNIGGKKLSEKITIEISNVDDLIFSIPE